MYFFSLPEMNGKWNDVLSCYYKTFNLISSTSDITVSI